MMPKYKLTEQNKIEIIKLLETTKLSYAKIGAKFGVTRSPVDKIVKSYNIKRDNICKNGTNHVCYMCEEKFYFPAGCEGEASSVLRNATVCGKSQKKIRAKTIPTM